MCGIFFFFGRSKRFRAEDHLPVPFASAIQTFLCGGSRLPFGSGFSETRFACRCPWYLHLSPWLLALCGHPWIASFVACVCVHGQVCLGVHRSQASSVICWRLRCSRFLFLVGFSCLSYVCCGVLAIRWCLLCFRWYWPSLEGSMDWARAYLRNAPVQAPSPELDQAEAWGSQGTDWQVGGEVWRPRRWCHVEGRLQYATSKVGHWHQVPVYPREGGLCSVYPWGSVLPREEGQVDAEAPRQEPQGQVSKFRLILVESRIHRLARYYRCVKFLPSNWKYASATASTGTCHAPFNDERINFFGRSRQRMRSKRFCAEDRGFLSEGEGAVPFWESLDFGIRSF